uniref:Uncharacterized protein n=1 Tax=Timema genevievae TaxID=629358 RepID=A0A7R9K329_TIMGE|nr:unnamed protein product [Timema genevievae]
MRQEQTSLDKNKPLKGGLREGEGESQQKITGQNFRQSQRCDGVGVVLYLVSTRTLGVLNLTMKLALRASFSQIEYASSVVLH